jgi:predicted secreted acid phosphatase
MSYWANWPKCEYTKDLQWAADVTTKYLIAYKKKPPTDSKPAALIFDIDDTLIFGDPEKVLNLQELTFDVPGPTGEAYEVEISPPNMPIINLLNNARKMEFKIILLTARPPSCIIDTIKNMEIFGILYDKLIMNTIDKKGEPLDPCFKLKERKKLNAQFNIVATIGDQLTDVYLPGAHTLVVKLPDIKSKCSYIIPPM